MDNEKQNRVWDYWLYELTWACAEEPVMWAPWEYPERVQSYPDGVRREECA